MQIATKTELEIFNDDLSLYRKLNSSQNINDSLIVRYLFDKDSFNILCIRETADLYYVITNHKQPEIKIIRKNPEIRLVKWDEYILSSSSVCGKMLVYDKIGGKLILPKDGLLKPVKFESDWLLIEWEYYNYQADRFLKEAGWIRWRKDNAILISAIYLR